MTADFDIFAAPINIDEEIWACKNLEAKGQVSTNKSGVNNS